jgi:hypothetical protein
MGSGLDFPNAASAKFSSLRDCFSAQYVVSGLALVYRSAFCGTQLVDHHSRLRSAASVCFADAVVGRVGNHQT